MAQKIRVFTLAREFGLDNDTMVDKIQEMGVDARNYMSALDTDVAQRIRRALQKERADNTIEERIRPTVVRRRTKDGAPSKPKRVRPPKVEALEMEARLVRPDAPKRRERPKSKLVQTPRPETVETHAPSVADTVLSPVQEQRPELVKTPVREPQVAKVATPEMTSPPVKEETVSVVEALAEAAPEPVSQQEVQEAIETTTPAPPPIESKLASSPSVETAVLQSSEPPAIEQVPDVVEDGKSKGKRPRGIEVATGPAVRRPSAEAPVIRRRVSPVQSVKPRQSTRTSSPSPSSRSNEVIPDVTAMASFAQPAPKEGQTGRRGRSSGPQRRREVQSRDMVPQGRFLGVGPSAKFGGATPPGRKRRMAPGKKGKKTEITTPKASKRVIRIEEQVSLQELAKRMGIKATELLMHLMGMGVGTLNINSILDVDTAKIVASDFGYDVENVALDEEDLLASCRDSEEDEKDREVRPPVVTMMGHVDHGKTSLLDALRKSSIVTTEAGGITQHLGAYRVKTKAGTVAFIDTPGHEAFTAMRARGAHVTDMVVLVVAADDGVMPQTIEAINHARVAEVPIIVAMNKCDKAGADSNRTKNMLMEHNLIPEDLGGDIIMVEVSAKTGTGLDKLVEMIMLQAEVMELSANPKKPSNGIVLEAYLDRGRGPVANILVQDGTLQVGEVIVAGPAYGKIRALTDERGRQTKSAGPSTPVEVLGLDSVPLAGDPFDTAPDLKIAEKVAKTRTEKSRAAMVGMSKPSLDNLFEQMQASNTQVELKIIVKGDVQGSVEALKDSLEKLTTDKVKLTVVQAAVGGITESDVLLASTADAIIIGFNVRPAGKARRVAEEQGVEIRLFSIIYEVIDSVRQAMVGLLEPDIKEEVLGQVEVRDTFNIPKVGTIAGSYVTDGKVIRNSRARLIRDSVQIWEGKLSSLRRFKDDVKEVSNGFECGISLEGYNDVKVGDVIEIYTEKEVAATLS